jgi:HK97 family phage prohead protease
MTEQAVLVRSFDAQLQLADGRNVIGRAVPYGVVADVMDRPGGPVYREGFDPGSFGRAVRAQGAGRRSELRYEHGRGLLDVIGPAQDLEERDDGLWGHWRALEGAVGDQALAMVESGLLRWLSVGFRPLGPGRREGGVLWRNSCHLDEVSLTRDPAYAGAEVVAVRHKLELQQQLEQLRGPARDEALDQRLRQLGLLA